MPYRHIPERSLARFWSKVEKTPTCWLWRGALNSEGYGNVGICGRYWRAHRYAYSLLVGPIPDDMDLCHHCDTPACVNPGHLFVGTKTDNMRDASAKGRTVRGERHPEARLSFESVREIRLRYAAGCARVQIAADFGICTQHVWRIATRQAWSHDSA